MRPTTGSGEGLAWIGPATGELPRAFPAMPVTVYGVPLTRPSTAHVAGAPSGVGCVKQFQDWPVAGSMTVAAKAVTSEPSVGAVKPTSSWPDRAATVSAGATVGIAATAGTAPFAVRKSYSDETRV